MSDPQPPSPEFLMLGVRFAIFLHDIMGPEQAEQTIDAIANQMARCSVDGYELGLLQSCNPSTGASVLALAVSSPTAKVQSIPGLITHLCDVQTHIADQASRN
jgi:hypothetical protein